jgi:uncharacterized membrane protein YkvA (DUF1232 family)
MPKLAPQDLKKWLMVVAFIYFVFPRDLVPDYIGGGLGLLDDIALMGLLTYYYRRYAAQFISQQSQQTQGQSSGENTRKQEPASNPNETSDPYAVLGLPRSASQKEIQSAYRARMGEYHPDKVEHLGKDLRALAYERTLEIQRAYKQLQR